MADAWAEQYEAWLDARADWLSEDDLAENECPQCYSEIDVDYRYCKACGEFV